MPPVRGTRRVGLKRIDAALDALRPMGFSNSLVRRTVRNLLKVYGGDDGWTFIEDSSYKLLIETILEELENSQNDNNVPKLLIEDRPAKDEIVHSPKSKEVIVSPLRDHPDKKLGTDMLPLPPIASASTPSSDKTNIAQCTLNDELFGVKPGNLLPSMQKSSEGVHSLVLCSPPTVDSLPPRRRKPCYGWLSSDDEEEPGPLSLVPATQLSPQYSVAQFCSLPGSSSLAGSK